jgi:molybdopterin molybdotransferase
MINYQAARRIVREQVGRTGASAPRVEQLRLADARGRVLARDVVADRDYPPFDRSARDGYAVRAEAVREGAALRCVGEIKAGDAPPALTDSATCLQIMTGASLPIGLSGPTGPGGADAVVMIEHTQRDGDVVRFTRRATAGQNVVARGSEAKAGQTVLSAGMRLGYAEMAQAAQVGAAELWCAARPRVAILSTGDEIVPFSETPGPFQIRNSNAVSLTAQVVAAGGEPVMLGHAADREEELREKISLGLREDVLVLSGGVSMGKYDLVENVLREMGAEFFFDAVAIRPGKPSVFGICEGKAVFGLPGNPVSTMVTFELFVVPAIDLRSGAAARELPVLEAMLAEDLNERPGMTHFLPARVEWGEAEEKSLAANPTGLGRVRALKWQSSGDIGAMVQANCFLVVAPELEHVAAGTRMPILLRRDVV